MITENMAVVANLETRYLSGGPDDAPTVVFFHDGAYGGSSDVTWGGVLPLAAEKFKVIAPDFLGYGGSAKSIRVDVSPFAFRIKHIFSLLDHLGIADPVHLVGNSFGGSMGLRALADPQWRERIASVTTINGTGGPWRSPEMAKLGDFDGSDESLDNLMSLLVDKTDGYEDQKSARMHWASQPGHFTTMKAPHMPVPEALKKERPADPYPEPLRGVEAPVLLVEGTRDVLLQDGWPTHLAEVLPNAEARQIDHMHSPNITHPEEVWELLSEFLERQSQGGN